MDIQEYPKALYKGGDVDAEHVIVAGKEDEAAKRKAGYKMLGEAKGKGKDEPKPADPAQNTEPSQGAE